LLSAIVRRCWRPAGLYAALALVALATLNPAREGMAAGSGVHLVMVEAPNCIYCRKWDAEVGTGYAKSDEGRFAPLTRVQRGAPAIKNFAPAIFTPTFIVARGTEEVGRITGYPGNIFFWEELYPILVAAGYPPRTTVDRP